VFFWKKALYIFENILKHLKTIKNILKKIRGDKKGAYNAGK
jgi:hypothetical protein